MRNLPFIALSLMLLLPVPQALAAARPKTCLVLAGGGALGIAHVGVIKVLEEEHVPIDCIVGTSMGAIVGGLYASGFSSAELEALVRDSNWGDLFTERAPRADRMFEDTKDDYAFLMPFRIGIDKKGNLTLPRGLIRGDKIDVSFLLFALRSGYIHDFDKLPIQFRAMASNLETGNPVQIGRGNLAAAMHASMSVPAIFTPATYPLKDLVGPENPNLWVSDTKSPAPRVYLVDGGVADNLPIDVARKLGAERVIAVHLPTTLKTNKELSNAFSIAGQMISVMIKQNEDRQLATLTAKDLLIQPDVREFSSASFGEANAIIPKGIEAADAMRPQMKRFAVSEQEFAAIRARQYRPDPEPVQIGQVNLVNHTRLNNEVILNYLNLESGQQLTIADLQQNVTRLYGTGLFETVSVDLVPVADGDRTNIAIHTVASTSENAAAENAEIAAIAGESKPTTTHPATAEPAAPAGASTPVASSGPPPVQNLKITTRSSNAEEENLRFGLSLSDDFDGDSNYNLAVRYTRRALNELGGKLDVHGQVGQNNIFAVDWYQPLTTAGDWFVAPQAEYTSFTASPLSPAGVEESEYRVREALGGVDVGYNWGFNGQGRMGYRAGTGRTNLQIGDPNSFPDNNFTLSYALASLDYDSLDDVNFPTQGVRATVAGTNSAEGLGASDDYQQTELLLAGAQSWGRNSFLISSRAQLNMKDDAPIQAEYLTGGFLNLSGYQQNSILTENYWLNKVVAYRLVSNKNWLVSVPVRIGGSVEMASLASDYSDINLTPSDQIFAGSVFIGISTILGPVYVAYGQAEGGQQSAYFFLGKTF